LILFANLFICAGLLLALQPDAAGTGEARSIGENRRRRTIMLFWTAMGGLAIAHYLLQWPTHWRGDFQFEAPLWAIVSGASIAWWKKAP